MIFTLSCASLSLQNPDHRWFPLFLSDGLRLFVVESGHLLDQHEDLVRVAPLVVVPGHDLNLIGVVAATLNFCTFPSSSSQFCNNSYSTRTYRCRTKTGLFVPKLYHVSASFVRIWFVSLLTCIFQISAYIFTTFHGSNALGLGLPPGQQLSQTLSSEALWQLDCQHVPAD